MFCYSKEHCPKPQFYKMENLHPLLISYWPYNKYLNNLPPSDSNHQEYFLLQETHPYHQLKSTVKMKTIIFSILVTKVKIKNILKQKAILVLPFALRSVMLSLLQISPYESWNSSFLLNFSLPSIYCYSNHI